MNKITREETIKILAELADKNGGDTEAHHIKADQALLDYIGDPEIGARFDAIEKWYS